MGFSIRLPLIGQIKGVLYTALLLASAASAAEVTVFVGTYTNAQSKGIYSMQFDEASGKLSAPTLAVESPSPSFLTISSNGRYLYAANEHGTDPNPNAPGQISAFTVEGNHLKLINSVSSRGAGPCHVAIDRTGHWLFAANYGSGSVSAFPIQANGALGEASSFFQHTLTSVSPRQQGPHAHMVVLSPDNRFLLVADLGGDRVFVYRFDERSGKLTLNDPPAGILPPGSGPRHIAFSKDGRLLYVLSELQDTVTTFRWDASKGALESAGSLSALPDGYAGAKSGAEIVLHPSGKFLYTSNRGHDSIAMFSIGADGKLTAQGHQPTGGKTPRNFNIDPTGKFLLAANQDSSTIAVFRIDEKTGRLTPAGDPVAVPTPVAILFMPRR
ncbi:MAG: lactonase family protein [Acidobacteriota bacterium]